MMFSKKKIFFEQDGFSLVEVLLVVAISAIVLSSVGSLVATRTAQEDLNAKAQEVVDIIARARNYSVTGYRRDVWGIRINNDSSDCQDSADCVILHKGMFYASRDTAFDQSVSLGTGKTGVYIDASEENEFYFSYIAGWLSTSTNRLAEQTITLSSNYGGQKTVSTTPMGVVYYGN